MENLVGFVKSSFFKVRRFHDEEDLRQQLRAWHKEVNQERPCRATGVIPAVRWAEEKSCLRPLKVQPEELALRIPVYVGPTGTVLHDGHAYSMPPEATSVWCVLRGEIPPIKVELSGGGAMKTEARKGKEAGVRRCGKSTNRGMLRVDRVGDRRSSAILVENFSVENGGTVPTERDGPKRTKRSVRFWATCTGQMQSLQDEKAL